MKQILGVAIAVVQLMLSALGENTPAPALGTNAQVSRVAPSTAEMVRTLERIGARFDDDLIAQRPDMHLSRFVLSHGENTAGPRAVMIGEARAAYEMLLKGESREAAKKFGEVKASLEATPLSYHRMLLPVIRRYLAVSQLRVGEQENCLCRSGVDSCLLPIRGQGVHTRQEGSRAAIAEFTEMLKVNPSDLTTRWLLNIAYMTLGEHPAKVPPEWLIPQDVFKSEAPFPRLYDYASKMDIEDSGLAGGCVMEDFDNDGYIDLMASSFGLTKDRDQLRYFHNNGDGTFSDRGSAAGLEGLVGGMNLVQADYNNDGFVDVFVLRGGSMLGKLREQPSSLLRNNGDGTFTDATREAGLLFYGPTEAGAWADVDNDGWLDLFVGLQSNVIPGYQAPDYLPYAAATAFPCKLFHNNRDGTFTDIAAQAGLDVKGYIKGAVFGDYDNDGRPDLLLTQSYGSTLLFPNLAPGSSNICRFGKPLELQPMRGSVSWFWDYDQDGWLDIFAAAYSTASAANCAGQVAADYLGLPYIAEVPRLLRNNRGEGFSDVTIDAKLKRVFYAQGGNFGDFDNDGWPDLYLATGADDFRALIPNRMLRNDGGRLFQDVTTAAGVGRLQKGHGVAVGDIDNNGTQDIYVVLGGEFSGDVFQNALYLTPTNANHWLTLKLEGTRSNRSAIGARLKLEVESESGLRALFATVNSGGSTGASTLQQEIGLGRAVAIRSLEITWPTTGQTQIFHDLPLDRRLHIREDKAGWVVMNTRPISVPALPLPAKPIESSLLSTTPL
ncbi:MAG: CRTAC1 family protein [Verrucomicrobiota bacterium]